jgi:hypothetical protein
VHSDNPKALVKLWAANQRPKCPDDPDLYQPYAILKRRKGTLTPKEVLVEWVGFKKNQATWEPEAKIAEAAPDILEEYFANRSRNERDRKAGGRVKEARGQVTKPKRLRRAKQQL